MADRNDFLLDENDDLLIINGDFAIGGSNQQHIIDTINADLAWWGEFPEDGVGIINFSNSAGENEKLARKLKIELEKDGFKINNPIIEFDASGKLVIYPNATYQDVNNFDVYVAKGLQSNSNNNSVIDPTVIQGSNNAVSGNGVYLAIEGAKVQTYKIITANTTIDNTFHNAIVLIKASVTLTLNAGLRSDFNFVARTFEGFTATYAVGSGATISTESDGTTQSPKKTASIFTDGANNYIITGTNNFLII